jgi:acyl carrier protein
VMGAMNLHQQSSRCPLDFFVLFSSSASLLPTAGQSNYAAANAFLDGLAAARRAAGQAAVSVNWGPWADAGMGTRVSTRDRERWQRLGIGSITVDQGTGVLTRILAGAPPQVCVLPVDWRAFAASYPADARPSLIKDLADGPRHHQPAPAASAVVVLPELLRQLPASERRQEVYRHVCDVVRRVFGVDPSFALDPQQGLRDLGLDSLMAVELRNDLQRSAGQSLPSTLAFDYPSLESLAHYLTTLLSADLPSPDATATNVPPAEVAKVDAGGEVRDLSDEEAEALLAEELNK